MAASSRPKRSALQMRQNRSETHRKLVQGHHEHFRRWLSLNEHLILSSRSRVNRYQGRVRILGDLLMAGLSTASSLISPHRLIFVLESLSIPATTNHKATAGSAAAKLQREVRHGIQVTGLHKRRVPPPARCHYPPAPKAQASSARTRLSA